MLAQIGASPTRGAHGSGVVVNRPWAVILAGGEGTRLRPLTKILAGDDRPKQFCKVIGGETLLQQTTRRLGQLVQPEKTLTVVTRTHAHFLDPGVSPQSVLVQPENRGTAPAILYSLLTIASREPGAHVGLFPADHYLANDAVFMKQVARAFGAIRQRPDLIITIGVVPYGPEVDYGWIEPGLPIEGVANGSLFEVRQFWEKPSRAAAEQLFAMGCLWNSFVIIGSVRSLVGLMRRAVPDLCEAFHDAQQILGTTAVDDLINVIYRQIPTVDFSRDVLAACPTSLTVLPVAHAGWVDVGRPDRVRTLLSKGNALHSLSA
ncbi:MAG: sugar phosphate nucleotidyltransferase [Acidobacteriota bacterium]